MDKGVRLGLLLVATTGPVAAFALPLYELSHQDYVASEPLTSSGCFPGTYPAAEVPGGAPAVAWVRGTSPRTIRSALTNPTPTAHSATLVVSDAKFHSPFGVVALSVWPSSAEPTFPTMGESNVVEFQVSGLPNYVSLGPITADVSCESAYAVLNGDDIGHMLHLLDGTPKGQGEGDQVPVWKEVLDDACWWARGTSGTIAVRDKVTAGLFGCGYATYNGGTAPEYYLPPLAPEPARFRLSLWSSNKLLYAVLADCSDTACYQQIACAALGVVLPMGQHNPLSPTGAFRTNLICAIGSDPSNYLDYYRTNWNFHRTAHVGGEVWDACAAQYNDPFGGTWQKPVTGWAVGLYWQNWVSSQLAFGLAKGYAGIPDELWSPIGRNSVPFSFLHVE